MLRTLAAAYAEAGRFTEAVTTAQRAVQFAAAQANSALANNLQAEVELYQTGFPFRDTNQTIVPASPTPP